MVAIFKMSAKTHQSATISTKIDDLEDFRPEECDSDKCDLKMVAIAAIMVVILAAIFNMVAKTRHKKWAVKIRHCLISSKFDMWVDNDVPN